jgi:hypothetical protein
MYIPLCAAAILAQFGSKKPDYNTYSTEELLALIDHLETKVESIQDRNEHLAYQLKQLGNTAVPAIPCLTGEEILKVEHDWKLRT